MSIFLTSIPSISPMAWYIVNAQETLLMEVGDGSKRPAPLLQADPRQGEGTRMNAWGSCAQPRMGGYILMV